MFRVAEENGGMVIFAEHRYFGESLPYSIASYSKDKIGYLTPEQAMADYAMLVKHIKEEERYRKSKVIVFGGSYGGMLAAWLRMKYPNIFDGAIGKRGKGGREEEEGGRGERREGGRKEEEEGRREERKRRREEERKKRGRREERKKRREKEKEGRREKEKED